MLVKTYCAAVNGLEATIVTIEVSITRGTFYHLTGLADEAVRESHDRIVAALLNNGYKFPVADITVNMAPADIRKEGSGYDLPLAIGILAANGNIKSDRPGSASPSASALRALTHRRSSGWVGAWLPRESSSGVAAVIWRRSIATP